MLIEYRPDVSIVVPDSRSKSLLFFFARSENVEIKPLYFRGVDNKAETGFQ